MSATRRRFLRTTVGTTLLAGTARRTAIGEEQPRTVPVEELESVAAAPVLRVDELAKPVTIAAMELLRTAATSWSACGRPTAPRGSRVPNAMHLVHTYPIFLNRVAPFFVGKDARQLEDLLWELYRHDDNYKYQGLALWVCVAAAEFADPRPARQADRQVDRRPAGRRQAARDRGLPGQRHRGNTPEEEIAYLKQIVAESGAKALKFRLGGRMSKNADSLPGRTERLIPMVREAFGPDMTLYADSNSSYDVRRRRSRSAG